MLLNLATECQKGKTRCFKETDSAAISDGRMLLYLIFFCDSNRRGLLCLSKKVKAIHENLGEKKKEEW